jgi:hypothetical protein
MWYFRGRVPADLKEKLAGQTLSLRVGGADRRSRDANNFRCPWVVESRQRVGNEELYKPHSVRFAMASSVPSDPVYLWRRMAKSMNAHLAG